MLGEPEELSSLFVTYPDSRSMSFDCSSRQDRLLRPPSTRTAVGARAFARSAASLLNSVPDDMRRLTPAPFKRAAKSFVCDTRPVWVSVCVECVLCLFVYWG